MKVLIIPSWYPSRGAPINGIFFKEQAVALAGNGHEVTVIDVTFHGRKDIFNATNFRLIYENVDGVHTYSFRMPSFFILSRIQPLYVLIYKLLLFFVFRKLYRKGLKFDILHAHSFYPAGYGACELSKKYGIPLVVTEHSSGLLKSNRRLPGYQQNLLRKTAENSSAFICVSESLLQCINEQTKIAHKLFVVPNMVSSNFTYSKEEQVDDFLFLSVGSLIKRKRHGFVVSCFEEAFAGMCNVRLQIAGDGKLHSSLQHQIANRGLSKQIQLLGNLSRAQLAIKFSACKAFILASAFETFGVVYIEAMACGKPVIAARNGGANGIVNETNGILIDVDNREQLVEAFRYMYHNAHKYNGQQIAADCRAKYSEEAVTREISEIYQQIAK